MVPKVAAFLFAATLTLLIPAATAQVDEDETGAWYMYMWTKNPAPGSRFGWQGDVQYRNWDFLGDLEQLLIRGGATWQPENSAAKYTLGYAYVATGAYGPSSATTDESRLYQEALIPGRLGQRTFLTHRLRLEQRWVENQDQRNRFRWFLGLNRPFNQDTLGRGAVYLALYNELFLNLERGIGQGRRVDHYDRNRAYAALGYSVRDDMRLQFGYMYQDTDNYGKGQLQFNLFHTW